MKILHRNADAVFVFDGLRNHLLIATETSQMEGASSRQSLYLALHDETEAVIQTMSGEFVNAIKTKVLSIRGGMPTIAPLHGCLHALGATNRNRSLIVVVPGGFEPEERLAFGCYMTVARCVRLSAARACVVPSRLPRFAPPPPPDTFHRAWWQILPGS